MRILSIAILSSVVLLGSASMTLADSYIRNADSDMRKIVVTWPGYLGTTYTLGPNARYTPDTEDFSRGTCQVEMDGQSFRLHDNEGYAIKNGQFVAE